MTANQQYHSAASLSALLGDYRLPMGSELRLQNEIELILQQNGVQYLREHRFDPVDRIDFLVGDVGIECKIGGSRANVLSQLTRYAEQDAVSGLILVSTRHTHRFSARELCGKPFHIVRVGVHL